MPRTSTFDTVTKRPTRPQRGKTQAIKDKPAEKGVRNAVDTSTYEGAAQIDPDKPLTASQLAFAQHWAKGESIASAALRAGYSQEAIGYRLVRMPNVLRVYQREKQLYEASCQMSRQRVMDGLLEAIDMAKLMSEPATMVSGWREVGRMCGYYEPVKHTLDISVKGEVTVRQLNAMSDADLLKIITGPGEMTPPTLTLPDDTSNDTPEEDGA